MAVTIERELPGGTTHERLQEELRRALGRPGLVVDDVACSPVGHTITAPATGSLSAVRVRAHDDGALELRMVVKVLQPAMRGLPTVIPLEDRQRIAAAVPWRLEAEVYTSGTAALMPEGLRLPRVYAVVEHPDERMSLWLEDVDPIDAPWTQADLARAAAGLGRLTVRRRDQVLRTRPDTTFLAHLVANALHRWAIPVVRGEEVWAQQALRQPPVAALRGDLLDLADEVDDLLGGLLAGPLVNTHGDPTPMNLLRPRSAPDDFVLIDWGTAALGPIGWDLVPLVFGPAENGTAPATELAARLATVVPAFEAGLRAEGMVPPAGAVLATVRACALIRYPLTSLPYEGGPAAAQATGDPIAYARRKAEFVRAVLDLCR
jgi:hypothetical protein